METNLPLRPRLSFAAALGAALGLQVPLWLGLYGTIWGIILGVVLAVLGAYALFFIEETTDLIDRSLKFILSIKTGLFWAYVFYLGLPAIMFAFDCLFILSLFILLTLGTWTLTYSDHINCLMSILFSALYTLGFGFLEHGKLVREYQNTVFLTVWKKFLADAITILQFGPLRNDAVRHFQTISKIVVCAIKFCIGVLLMICLIVVSAVTTGAKFLHQNWVYAAAASAIGGFIPGWIIYGQMPGIARFLTLLLSVISALAILATVQCIQRMKKMYQPQDWLKEKINRLWPGKFIVE